MENREVKCFCYNGKNYNLPVLEVNDRVKLKDYSTMREQPKGTVIGVSEDKFFIDIQWDKESYPVKSNLNGQVKLGLKFLAPSLILFKE